MFLDSRGVPQRSGGCRRRGCDDQPRHAWGVPRRLPPPRLRRPATPRRLRRLLPRPRRVVQTPKGTAAARGGMFAPRDPRSGVGQPGCATRAGATRHSTGPFVRGHSHKIRASTATHPPGHEPAVQRRCGGRSKASLGSGVQCVSPSHSPAQPPKVSEWEAVWGGSRGA
ncbi:MAG: hypothetical protein WDW36_003343 [Sanguina aurantia]